MHQKECTRAGASRLQAYRFSVLYGIPIFEWGLPKRESPAEAGPVNRPCRALRGTQVPALSVAGLAAGVYGRVMFEQEHINALSTTWLEGRPRLDPRFCAFRECEPKFPSIREARRSGSICY
jgi:hypothetical protein